MAEFAEYLQRLRPSQSYTEMAMNMNIQMLNPTNLENFLLPDLSLDTFFAHHHPEFPPTYAPTATNPSNDEILNSAPSVHNSDSNQNYFPCRKKQKVELQSTSSSKNISPAVSITITKKNNNLGRGKKGKNKEKEVEKADKVIHVRAKRGQATDSHSIAERVRREKINNKLRCLQDLVPGCHKSMGMAVMLEEIINYVHSLQNQVEFLSMELAAASSPHNFNLVTESSKKFQVTNSPEAQHDQTQKLRERYGELNCYQSTWSIL